jgi:hypothetical protein
VSQIIKPKRRHTAGVPTTSDLEPNEIAINTHDFSIYVRDDANNILRVGGVQTPMSQNLDTNHFTITDSYSSDTAPATVNFTSPLCLPKYTSAETQTLIEVDPADCIVGDTYKIEVLGNTTNAQWSAMGAQVGGSGTYQDVVFTCTAAGPSGTTGRVFIGLDSTGSDQFNGMIIFNTDIHAVQVYRAFSYSWGTI